MFVWPTRTYQYWGAWLLGGFVFLAGHGSRAELPAPWGERALAPPASGPREQAMAEAWASFQRGAALRARGELEPALAELGRAHQLSSDPALLFDIAQLEQELGRNALAADALGGYLRELGPALPEARRAATQRQLDALSARTGTLLLQTNVQGATIELDDAVVNARGFGASISVDAGKRRVSLSKPGYETKTLWLELAPGETQELRVDLDKATAGRSDATAKKPRWT